MRVLDTIVRFFKARCVGKKIKVTDDTSTMSRRLLLDFLREIEVRVQRLPEMDNNRMLYNGMSRTQNNKLNIAVRDWDRFCEDYECTIGYNDSLKESECFYLYIRETAHPMAPADWEVRFTNLKKI